MNKRKNSAKRKRSSTRKSSRPITRKRTVSKRRTTRKRGGTQTTKGNVNTKLYPEELRTNKNYIIEFGQNDNFDGDDEFSENVARFTEMFQEKLFKFISIDDIPATEENNESVSYYRFKYLYSDQEIVLFADEFDGEYKFNIFLYGDGEVVDPIDDENIGTYYNLYENYPKLECNVYKHEPTGDMYNLSMVSRLKKSDNPVKLPIEIEKTMQSFLDPNTRPFHKMK